jgi:hypothetical protein
VIIAGRAWFKSGVGAATDDPIIQVQYGELVTELAASRALARAVADRLQEPLNRGDALTADERGGRRRDVQIEGARDAHCTRRHQQGLRGDRSPGDRIEIWLRSLLAQRAHPHAARPRALQGARDRRILPLEASARVHLLQLSRRRRKTRPASRLLQVKPTSRGCRLSSSRPCGKWLTTTLPGRQRLTASTRLRSALRKLQVSRRYYTR